jgi:lipopolysaccharide/colanic/teichoic acid biosynthesis glycosyltransferase
MQQAISLNYSKDAMNTLEKAIKRGADILFSLLGLTLLSPLFLLIAILLHQQGNGSVLFKQERIGRGGRPFTIFKFRTMSSIVEDEGPQLIAQSDAVNSTPIERFLRDHHLDELPQLWNVLRGDMSIVGHRPERKYFIDKIMQHNPAYAKLYAIRPGLTSEATLYNGYTDSMQKMLRRLDMDLYYLEHRSLWMDTKIIFLTAVAMIRGLF